MNKILIFLSFCLLISESLLAQDKPSKYSISAGLNLFIPTLIYRNENNLKRLNLSWQASINRHFAISSMSALKVSMGFREDAFTAQTDFNNTVSGTPITLVRKIELGYIQLALDYLMIKEVSTCSFFGGVGLRSSFLTYENFTSFYPFSGLSSSDFGGNIFCGVKFLSILRKPALQLNYYHGFLKIAENSVRDANNDVYNDELRSKSISLLLTLDLKK